jgi:SAM-dependent methyltransferase
MTTAASHAQTCLAAYDLWAATYDRIDNPLVAQAGAVLAERARWFAGARVLELGCGTGRNAAFCLEAGAAGYVGIDGSAAMLAQARRRFEDSRVAWMEADLLAGAARAGRKGARFDVVLLCLVLEHLEDVEPVIAAGAATLARGGRLIMVELHPSLHDCGIGANFTVGELELRLPSFRHTAEELVQATGRAGLRPILWVDHLPTAPALARSAKLARYVKRPVLVEVVAARD